eukprot:scaffold11177_cov61-Cylindrotheca_fusiformis.AAC.2
MAKKKKSAAQIRRLEQRALKRGETYVPPPPSLKEEEKQQDVEPTKLQEEEENVEQDMEQTELDDDATSKKRRLEIAIRLINELKAIDEKKEQELFKSKDRRSAKRKAEAIAAEESGMPVVELLKWYETQQQKSSETKGSENKNEDPLVVETKRRKAALKLQSALQDIETNAEMKAKDRRSAKRKAEAIAAEESGMSAEELLQWFESQEPKQKDKESNKKQQQQQRNHDPYIAFIGQLSFDTTQEQLLEH